MRALTRRPARCVTGFRLGPALVLVSALALAACDSAEDRAEAHYQRAVELLAQGDDDRAMIEFRNVFRQVNAHTEARRAYARLLRDRGELPAALNQYQRLVEQDSSDVAGARELTELALQLRDLSTARTSAELAYALAPEDPEIRALKATLDYSMGGSGRDDAVEMARAVVAELPGNVAAQMVLIADRLQQNDAAGALALADTALASAPADEGLRLTRLAALERLGDQAEIGAELGRMVELFPDNTGMRQGLVQWHLREGDQDAALAVLRASAELHPEDPQGQLTVVQFLYELQGPAAARAEVERLIAAQPDATPYRRALAGLDFSEGRTDEAIAAMRALLVDAPASDDTREVQVALAGMLDAVGDVAGRDAMIAAVLEGDPTHVGALKLRARAFIAEDQPDRAVQDMRTALGQAPRDPEIMTIMAFAHDREGSRELAGERFAMAAEVSNYAAPEAVRYARFLMQDDRAGPAEGVIIEALRRTPNDPDLLQMLGQIHLARGDWVRARQVAGILRQQGDPAADGIAAELEVASLRGEDRRGETLAMLEGMASGGEDLRAMALLMQAHVEAGDLGAARTYVEAMLAEDPDSLAGRQMMAGLEVLEGDLATGEALYREVIASDPDLPQPHQALVTLLAGTGRQDEALAALDAGIAATGEDGQLLFLKAGLLEGRGDVDGAIAVYETLYARDSSSILIANNLASLLTTRSGSDAAALERAFAIARRLRGTDVPYFQDTYGWILHLRGDNEQALSYLEPAARALPGHALVHFHLGEAQLAGGDPAAARISFERAIELGGPEATLPQLAVARQRLGEIAEMPAAAPQAGAGQEG